MKKVKRNMPHVCFLCGKNGTADPLDKHHIFGGARRGKSEQYGLYVYLCHDHCHENGKHAAHRDPETAQLLHEYGQRLAMREQGWNTQEFIYEFGKNYLDPDEEPEYTPAVLDFFAVINEAPLPF